MPSPLAHLAAAYAVHRVAGHRLAAGPTASRVGRWTSLAAVAALTLLPDLDAVPGLLTGDIGRFHNRFTHGLPVGVAVAAVVWAAVRVRRSPRAALAWGGVALVSHAGHVAMDLLTAGRGVMALWPLSAARFQSPVLCFVGLRWAGGIVNPDHLGTVLNELPFVALVLCLLYLWGRRRHQAAAA
jgi:inner membrane protein